MFIKTTKFDVKWKHEKPSGKGRLKPEKAKKGRFTVGCYFSIVVLISYVLWHNIYSVLFPMMILESLCISLHWHGECNLKYLVFIVPYKKMPTDQNWAPQGPVYQIALKQRDNSKANDGLKLLLCSGSGCLTSASNWGGTVFFCLFVFCGEYSKEKVQAGVLEHWELGQGKFRYTGNSELTGNWVEHLGIRVIGPT